MTVGTRTVSWHSGRPGAINMPQECTGWWRSERAWITPWFERISKQRLQYVFTNRGLALLMRRNVLQNCCCQKQQKPGNYVAFVYVVGWKVVHFVIPAYVQNLWPIIHFCCWTRCLIWGNVDHSWQYEARSWIRRNITIAHSFILHGPRGFISAPRGRVVERADCVGDKLWELSQSWCKLNSS